MNNNNLWSSDTNMGNMYFDPYDPYLLQANPYQFENGLQQNLPYDQDEGEIFETGNETSQNNRHAFNQNMGIGNGSNFAKYDPSQPLLSVFDGAVSALLRPESLDFKYD